MTSRREPQGGFPRVARASFLVNFFKRVWMARAKNTKMEALQHQGYLFPHGKAELEKKQMQKLDGRSLKLKKKCGNTNDPLSPNTPLCKSQNKK